MSKCRILVFGAGVIGCNLAADLFASGCDVTLLARGEWADCIEKKGLTIKSAFLPGKKTYRDRQDLRVGSCHERRRGDDGAE